MEVLRGGVLKRLAGVEVQDLHAVSPSMAVGFPLGSASASLTSIAAPHNARVCGAVGICDCAVFPVDRHFVFQ